MFDRVMLALVVIGSCALGAFLLVQRYTAPACDANITTQKLVTEIGAQTGVGGVYLLHAHRVGGGLLGRTKQCTVDVAQIKAMQPLDTLHWLRVLYTTSIDPPTGQITVRSHVGGPVTPVFKDGSTT